MTRPAAVVALVAVLGVGCSGDDDAGAPASSTDAMAPAAESGTSPPVAESGSDDLDDLDDDGVTGSASSDDLAASTTSPTTEPPAEPGAEPGDDASGTATGSTAGSEPASAPVAPGAGRSLGALGDVVVELETDEGTVQIGSAEVPTDLDPTFPVPTDLDVEIASTVASDLGFTGSSATAIDDLRVLYESGLPEAGYEVVDVRETSSGSVIFDFVGPDGEGQVALSEGPGRATTIVVVTFSSS